MTKNSNFPPLKDDLRLTALAYRALRNMEDAGWVDSRWDDASQGPRRRLYQILPEGKIRLTIWMDNLLRTRDEIDRLLQTCPSCGHKAKHVARQPCYEKSAANVAHK